MCVVRSIYLEILGQFAYEIRVAEPNVNSRVELLLVSSVRSNWVAGKY